MGQRTFTVLVEWRDGEVCDADEFTVAAKSAAEAKTIARAMWLATVGGRYRFCRVEEILILTKCMMRSFA